MGIRPDIDFKTVQPKLDSENIGLVDAVEFDPPAIAVESINRETSSTSQAGKSKKGDVWKEVFFSLGITDFLNPEDIRNYRNFLKKIDGVVNVLLSALKILRIFSSDLKNISRALKFALKQIILTLKEFVDSFISTGVYFGVVYPDDSEKDISYKIPTWGSFSEFKSKIAASCLDKENPFSPSRLVEGNYVGGLIIGGLIGTNDSGIYDTMIYNLKLLGELFGIAPSFPSPPKNVKALPGLYHKGVSGKKLGIRVEWDRPDSKGVVGFVVYRCKKKQGVPPTKEDMDKIISNSITAKSEEHIRDFNNILVYDDISFEPDFVVALPGKDHYTFTDFEVDEGISYFYKVMSVIARDGLVASDPYNRRVDSPLMSPSVYATARFCIPTSELIEPILSVYGDFIDPRDYKYFWLSITLRTFFGPTINDLLDRLDQFTDSLVGLVQTSSDAISGYIDFLSTKIQNYIKIIDTITKIVDMLVNFRLRGSNLLLVLSAKPGGIENFVDRVKKSRIESKTYKDIRDDTTSDPAGLKSIKGLYFGIVMLYGYPEDPSNLENYDHYVAPYREEYNDVVRRIERSQRSISFLTKILLGE